MRNISNSEVTTWLTCRRMYNYAFFRNLTPKKMSTPLFRGGTGHEAFQRYAEARIDGKTHNDALFYAEQVFVEAMKVNPSDAATVLETKQLFDRYMAHHKGWPEWRILSVEQRYELPLNQHMNITIRYDTMVEVIASGKVLIGDYKFTYDFWSTDDHSLNGQLPKYISVMNANGTRVDGGFLEEVRTRPLGAQKASDPRNLWRRTHYFPSNAKKVNTMRQHIAAGFEIINYWNATPEQREALSIPVLNKHGACKFCDFKELCASELDGGDITYAIEHGFVQNTYGYNHAEEKVEELL